MQERGKFLEDDSVQTGKAKSMKKIELLAPARDYSIGIAAINNGADAVYIGASAFGARKEAGNSLKDIEALVEYAHRFYSKVYVTLNTVLYDSELKTAEQLVRGLYKIGVDALIIQDMGLLQLDLPPISLHASTQMHNYELEKIKFLDRLGFQRIVLARELSLEQIEAIRKEIKAELEVFIHGALCVSLSGQCYLSQYMFGRSANRGECAQACRMKWTVKDGSDKILVRDKYVLSLKDLNMSAYINDLIRIGVDSFKIEGRLKDANYVSNTTGYYNSLINDQLKLKNNEISRLSSGEVISGFEADPERSFNRGFTAYFAQGRRKGLVNMESPKSMGKVLGKVKKVCKNELWLMTAEELHNGDGLCYMGERGLEGIRVNRVEGEKIICKENLRVIPGTVIYRNYDHQFAMQVEKSKSVRKIGVEIQIRAKDGRVELYAEDEDKVAVEWNPDRHFERAEQGGQRERIEQQLKKCGDTDFICRSVHYEGEEVVFIPVGIINEMRRALLTKLARAREVRRPIVRMNLLDRRLPYQSRVRWQANVVNKEAEAFYREHGALEVEVGFELTEVTEGKELMHTRYCLLYELGYCRKQSPRQVLNFPLYLCNEKYRFRLEFDCKECCMKILSVGKT